MDLLNEPVTPTVNGMDDHGWSNSPAVEGEPASVYPEVAPPEEFVPGQTNSAAVPELDVYGTPDLPPAGDAVQESPDVPPPGEDEKSVEPADSETKAVVPDDAENK